MFNTLFLKIALFVRWCGKIR